MLRLLYDSREQLPLDFRDGVFDEVQRATLSVGDYACEVDGGRVPIYFERKGFVDLFNTMSGNYDRFKAELRRAASLNIKLVLLIEGSMREVAKGHEHCQFSGDAMLKKLATMYLKYDLEYHFCVDRREMSRRIEDTFESVARLWKRDLSGRYE